ncbi:hypothetical protein C4K38_2887 [Pseudomonas chlororaphis subsp. piscium]|uniref:Uncharacterized protein n=1 Tax=Pseudomonas chlororaphis subsp. aureofaciens TaxID=587851 RepID=A0AAD1E613_9PSED|nr:hypothetical protein C4K38_2887 [Pseudomonas chlororaphis subsp. piscium]AZD92321.1 hypothetical protein C4K13_2904 [Pseudomonas chlororaphis subsp. aureofaciens]AZC82007.1 hypothetical protein C4K30_2893 [Pseudomonas chlororaphis subsp. piscium]AZE29597.1 hypothetical protein C4K07_2812 [Pseudomonas chlororaphis subsp. aureofaciens]AZE35900.1 hypothetical protein C4K06_2867 [Pseudomonas chlororaphis subsp. aureofaciens]
MTGLAKCYRTFVTKASFTRGWGLFAMTTLRAPGTRIG